MAWFENIRPIKYWNTFFQYNALFSKEHIDLIFNKRNKAYGAYLLRKIYLRNVLIAYIIAIVLFLLSFVIYKWWMNEEPVELDYMTEIHLSAPPEILLPKIRSQVLPEKAKESSPQKKVSRDKVKIVEDNKTIIEPKTENEQLQTETDSSLSKNKSQTNGDTESQEEPVFQFADIMPQFPGGPKALSAYISSKLVYPREAVQLQIEGTVLVGFIVDQYGRVRNPYIVESLIPVCDEEALRVSRSIPDWIPASNRGRRVSVHFRIPIEFRLKRN